MPTPQWHWKPLRTDDRLLTSSKWSEAEGNSQRKWLAKDKPYEEARVTEAKRLRRNFLAIEIVPSLESDQAYEARVWIEGQDSHPDYRPPDRVEWAASQHFFPDIHVCKRQEDPQFKASFSYYGPTLIQARLFWSNYKASAYIFARFPRNI
jgi:hypothetical protein